MRESTSQEQDFTKNSSPNKDAFDILMNVNSTKFPCKMTETVGVDLQVSLLD